MTKQKVDILLTHGWLVAMDNQFNVYPDGAIAIQGNLIEAVGPSAEIEASYQAATVIDCQGCIISPGLINAHTHVPMTLLRGLADDLRLDVWLYGYMMPVEREFVDHQFCYTGTLLACAEMICSGVTTFCDMYYNETEVARATAKAGIVAMYHDDGADGARAETPARPERVLSLSVGVEELDIERLAEVIAQIVRGSRLQRPVLAAHHRFDSVGAMRSGELLALGLDTGDNRQR